jgi:trypsin
MKKIFLGFFWIFLIFCVNGRKVSEKFNDEKLENCRESLINCELDDPIDGGEEIEINEAPHQVAILRNGNHICSGTMLSRRTVLTAAHCIKCTIKTLCDYEIRAGSSYKRFGGLIVDVDDYKIHPQYDNGSYNFDFALLLLEKVKEFPPVVSHARLPEEDDKVEVGQLMQIAGWGNISKINVQPEKLQAAKVPIYDTGKCQEAHRKSFKITEQMICAGYEEGKIDTCQGNKSRLILK